MKFLAFIGISILFCSTPTYAGGFGETTPGGSGKSVYRVKNLSNTGPGSLREALSQGNRHIAFDVSGTITLSKPLSVQGSYVTIDGTTSSKGITLKNYGFRISGSEKTNIIVKNIRIRSLVSGEDGVAVRDGANNILIDRISVDGCGDGNIDITRSAHHVTVKNSILSGCSKNSLIKYEAYAVSLYNNLFVETQWRNPWIEHTSETTSNKAPSTTADVRNNLIWNWGNSGGGTGVSCGGKANLVNNFYHSGASDQNRKEKAIMVNSCPSGGTGGLAYVSGNYSDDKLSFDINREGNISSPFSAPSVPTEDACNGAYTTLTNAGAKPLDSTDLAYLTKISLPSCSSPTSTPTVAPTSTPIPAATSTPIPVSTPTPDVGSPPVSNCSWICSECTQICE